MPMFRFRVFLCLVLCLAALCLPALAEDCFTINMDSLDMSQLGDEAYVTANLSAQTQGVRILKYISDSSELAARVRLTIQESETSSVIFDKNFGYVSGTFDSGDIYLPYVGNDAIPYQITLSVENDEYTVPFMRLQPRLNNNSGCTCGMRMKEFNPSLTNGWLMGTMLDLTALRGQGSQTIPLCASNLCLVGQATVNVNGDQLTVTLSFNSDANVTLGNCAVYVIGSVADLTSADPAATGQTAYAPGDEISIANLSTALLYVPFTLSYNPAGLDAFTYGSCGISLSEQQALWNANVNGG
jgi:hypothetical protein